MEFHPESSMEPQEGGRHSANEDDETRQSSDVMEKNKLGEVEACFEDDITITNNNKNSQLHDAVERGTSKLVAELLKPKWNADINLKNMDGETPLDIAIRRNDPEILELLQNYQEKVSIKNQQSTENEKMQFQKTKGSAAIEGQLCEINLITLFLLKATIEKCITSFHLASNFEKADKFDDIVMKYKNQKGNSKIIFLQAKHKKDGGKGLNVNSILSDSESGDFSLNKYFISYRKIRQNFLDKVDPIFSGNFDDCEFLMYTNASLEYGSNECINEIKVDENDLLQTGKCFQFVLDRNEKIFHLLKNSSDCRRLAKALAEAFASGSVLDVRKEIFQAYHQALQKKVIEKTGDSRGRLRSSFFKDDCQFSRVFFEEAAKVMKKSQNEVKEELQGKIIRLSDKFSAEQCGGCSDLPTDEPINKNEVQDFLNKFKFYASQFNEKELEKAIKDVAKITYQIEEQDIDSVFADVEHQIRNWWQNENFYLTKENKFFENAVRVSVQFDVKEPVQLFTGRVQELADLHRILKESGEVVISQMVSITGLGGIGKSELARKYLSEYKEHYDNNTIWIHADSYLTLSESFRRLAREKLHMQTTDSEGAEKEIHVVAEDVYRFFGRRCRKSIFVFDNASKHKTIGDGEGLDKYLPKSGRYKPHVLITSRDQQWVGIMHLPLGVFSETEAVQFIEKALKMFTVGAEAKKLAKELDYLPLALGQAVAYISAENQESGSWSKVEFTIINYLELFKKQAATLLDKAENRDRYAETVLTTWKVTEDKIREKLGGVLALAILNVMAYLDADNIPVDELFSKKFNNVVERHTAVELLDKYSMVELHHGKVSVHRLVQKVTRIELELRGKNKEVLVLTCGILIDNFPYMSEKVEDIIKKRSMMLHLEAILTHIDEWLLKNPDEKLHMERENLERLLICMDDGYDLSPCNKIEMVKRTLALQEKIYGSCHIEVAASLEELGHCYDFLGKFPEEKECYEKALAIFIYYFGPYSLEIATTLANLGNAYLNLGETQPGKALLEKALVIQKKHLGLEHIDYAKTLNNLSYVHRNLGEFDQAKQCLERSLTIQEKHYGGDHFQVAMVLTNLGDLYGKLGDCERQKELLERALLIDEAHYGHDHFELATTLMNLGNAYGSSGNVAKQVELLEKALEMQEKHYGPEHEVVQRTLFWLAHAYFDLGADEKLKKLFERKKST